MADFKEKLPELAYYYDLAKENNGESRDSGNRYTDRVLIGEGGMKRIEKSYDVHSGRYVALASVNDPENTTAFMHEARLTASLEHPNIIPVYDVGEIAGEPFFTMKLTRGKELGQYKEIDLKKRMLVFKKICEGVAYAHSKNIIHLDLKPQNIQVDHFGEVLICDWGLSKYIGAEDIELKKSGDLKADLTMTGTITGTPGYMAPEQLLGHKDQFDQQTDIFALACILHELVFEQTFFKGNDLEEYKDHVLNKKKYSFPDSNVPEALKAVMLKSFAHEKKDRYAHAGEIASEIGKWLNGFATEAQEAGLLTQFSLLVKRHKTIFTVIILAFLILIITSSMFVKSIINEKNQTLRESQKRISIAKKAAPEFLRQAKLLYDRYAFAEALEKVNAAVNLNPDLKEALYFKSVLMTGSLKFAEAAKVLTDQQSPLKNIIDTFDENYLDPKKFSNLLKAYKKNGFEPLSTLSIISITCEMKNDKKLSFIKEVLKEHYRDFTDEHFQYNSETRSLKVTHRDFKSTGLLTPLNIQHLDLTGTSVGNLKALSCMNLKSLRLRDTAIRTLPRINNQKLELLDLANTEISDLRQLKTMSVKILDLSGVEIKNLKPITECKSLEKVILSKDLIELNNQSRKVIRTLNIEWL